jgi:predicted RNase H-like nuclease
MDQLPALKQKPRKLPGRPKADRTKTGHFRIRTFPEVALVAKHLARMQRISVSRLIESIIISLWEAYLLSLTPESRKKIISEIFKTDKKDEKSSEL